MFNISCQAPKSELKTALEADIKKYDAVEGYNVMQHIWPSVEPLIADYPDTSDISVQVTASNTSTSGARFNWNLGVSVLS